MGFEFIAFGAATVPLSKVVIDKELDMGTYPIRAQYRPEEWATETLEWGDTAPSDYSPEVNWRAYSTDPDYVLFTNSGPGAKYRVKIRVDPGAWEVNSITVKVDGVTVASRGAIAPGGVYEPPAFGVETGQTVVISITVGSNGSRLHLSYQNTGEMWGAKTFDLSGKWLALGIDMHGLESTVKIQGVEIPYSEYVKAFPLAPSELSIPGDWESSQERPEIRVYK